MCDLLTNVQKITMYFLYTIVKMFLLRKWSMLLICKIKVVASKFSTTVPKTNYTLKFSDHCY